MAVALVIAVRARASLFDITFTDGGGNTGSGQITATDNGGGSYTSTSGFLTILSGGNLFATKYELVSGAAPVAQNINNTSGLNLNGDNQITYPGSPYLDSSAGLLFETAGGLDVINLWGNGPGSYSIYGAGQDFVFNGVQVNGNSTITLVPVPEASTMIAGALLLLPFGASTLRILRRNRVE